MSDSKPNSGKVELHKEELSRRDYMALGATIAIPLWFWGGDSDPSLDDLGFFDTHWISDDGEKLVIDPQVLDFADNIDVEETSTGVEISVDEESIGDTALDEWSEADDGTLEGPSLSTDPASITVDVPSDYDTVADALHNFRRVLPAHSDSTVTINIESGHEIDTSIRCRQGSWGHVDIIAEDSVVPVASSFPNDEDVIDIRHMAVGPRIRTSIDANGHGNHGMHVAAGSIGHNTSGVQNAGRNGLHVANTSICYAYTSDWSGAANNGVRSTRSSHVTLGGIEGEDPIGADVSNAGNFGIYAHRSSTVRATVADAHDCGDTAVYARDGSAIDVKGININDAGSYGLRAQEGSIISAYEASVTGTFGDFAVYTQLGGNISLRDADVEVSDTNAALRSESGVIACRFGSATGSDVSDMIVRHGGIMMVNGTETSSSTDGDPHEDDMLVTPNTLQGEGIIFAEDYESA